MSYVTTFSFVAIQIRSWEEEDLILNNDCDDCYDLYDDVSILMYETITMYVACIIIVTYETTTLV